MRMRTRSFVLALATAFTLAGPAVSARADHHEEQPAPAQQAASSDALVLKDGRRIEGDIVGRDERYVSIRSGGVLRAYPLAEVAQVIDAGPAVGDAPLPTPPATADRADRGDGAAADTAMGDGAAEPPAVDPKTANEKKTRKRADRAARRTDRDAAPLSPEARRWLAALLDRALASDDPDPAVARSITAAIRALGPGAAEQVERTARIADGPVAPKLVELARQLRERDTRTTDRATSDRAVTDAAPRGRRRLGEIVAELGLSREQRRGLRDALAPHIGDMREILAGARDAGTAREDVRAALAPVRDAAVASLRELLGAEKAAAVGDARLTELVQAIIAPKLGKGDRAKKRDRTRKRSKDATQ